MFEKTDKKRLYWLMNEYLKGNIDADVFCDEYYDCFHLELRNLNLMPLEEQLFSKLGTVVGRFSSFNTDHTRRPGVYYTEDELRKKIMETVDRLAQHTEQ